MDVNGDTLYINWYIMTPIAHKSILKSSSCLSLIKSIKYSGEQCVIVIGGRPYVYVWAIWLYVNASFSLLIFLLLPKSMTLSIGGEVSWTIKLSNFKSLCINLCSVWRKSITWTNYFNIIILSSIWAFLINFSNGHSQYSVMR